MNPKEKFYKYQLNQDSLAILFADFLFSFLFYLIQTV